MKKSLDKKEIQMILGGAAWVPPTERGIMTGAALRGRKEKLKILNRPRGTIKVEQLNNVGGGEVGEEYKFN